MNTNPNGIFNDMVCTDKPCPKCKANNKCTMQACMYKVVKQERAAQAISNREEDTSYKSSNSSSTYYIDKARAMNHEMYLRSSWTEMMNNESDGLGIEYCFDSVYKKKRVYKPKPMPSIKCLDTKKRKGKPINVLSMISYLASIQEIREIVYNNKWGIVVMTPKKSNYPEDVVLDVIKDIVMDGIQTLSSEDRYTALMYMDSAPEESIIGKIWNLIPSVTLHPVFDKQDILDMLIDMAGVTGVWSDIINKIEDFNEEEEVKIDEEDIAFWRKIYSTRKEALYGKTIITVKGENHENNNRTN